MSAMPAKGGVGRACMNEAGIDFGSDRGRAHVHIVVHVMRARVLVPMLMRMQASVVRARVVGADG